MSDVLPVAKKIAIASGLSNYNILQVRRLDCSPGWFFFTNVISHRITGGSPIRLVFIGSADVRSLIPNAGS